MKLVRTSCCWKWSSSQVVEASTLLGEHAPEQVSGLTSYIAGWPLRLPGEMPPSNMQADIKWFSRYEAPY